MKNDEKKKDLTSEQRCFAEFLADPARNKTQTEYAEEIGISINTLTRWKKLPAFRDYLEELLDELRGRRYSEIVKKWQDFAVEKLDEGKDHKAAKDWLDYVEKVDQNKKGISGGTGVTIIIDKSKWEFTEEEMEDEDAELGDNED